MKTYYEDRRGLITTAGLAVVALAMLGFVLMVEEHIEKDGKKMKPARFNFRANDVSNDGVPVIKPWKRIVLDPDYAGAWIVAGDGDGKDEIIVQRERALSGYWMRTGSCSDKSLLTEAGTMF